MAVRAIWIAGLLLLTVLFGYGISANLYRAGEPPAATRASPAPANAMSPSLLIVPVAAVAYAGDARNPPRSPVNAELESANKNDAAITIAEYVLLHQTRIERMPDRRAGLGASK
jgi:hypothetical protein